MKCMKPLQSDLRRMGKRKASVSIDDWLGEGGARSEVRQDIAVVAEGESARVDPTVTKVVVKPRPAEPVIAVAADVAVPCEEDAGWFWELLELAGYER